MLPEKAGAQNYPRPIAGMPWTLAENNIVLDLVVMTHVDDDHIGGLLRAIQAEPYQQVLGSNVWFNSGRLIASELAENIPEGTDIQIMAAGGRQTSIAQGIAFDDQLCRMGVSDRSLKIACEKIVFSWGEITILSPQEEQLRSLAKKWEHEESNLFTSGPSNDYGYSLDELLESDVFEEDKSVHNGSSIAFLIESGDAKALFLGDAHAPTICTSLRNLGYSEEEPLTVGLCKLSHHGSKANTSMELLSLIKSEVFIVSTNGLRHGLPNKRTIARIKAVSPNSSVLFNYPGLKERMFNTEELNDLGPFVQDIQGDISL
ncbi:MBL fold metallo-hydrolase [Escherichia fergusonii]|uniref:MBL fold metallo-hydrolase n=1 Tax=Escherichia fergusonii TaxID=564 RepID=A0A8E4IKN6_ESCFE|nr:MBL fold metallo-hydrolase [Escherichia fergusonii]QLN00627.1 MBL fold metallo-hydrolase [Escherichia fergusonii]